MGGDMLISFRKTKLVRFAKTAERRLKDDHATAHLSILLMIGLVPPISPAGASRTATLVDSIEKRRISSFPQNRDGGTRQARRLISSAIPEASILKLQA